MLIRGFDGADIGVRATNEDVVEQRFLRTGSFQGVVETPNVLLEGTTEDGHDGEFEVTADFGFDIGFEGALVALVVGLFEGGNL